MILETLNRTIRTVNDVPNIEKLNNESWEICILKLHRHIVKETLSKTFPGSDVHLYHNPFEPTPNDSKIWGYDEAKMLYRNWFFKRAIRICTEDWPASVTCYTYLLKVMCGLASDFTLISMYQGCLQSKEDAVYLLKSYLQGKLAHSPWGPQDGEATISGNIFIWKTSITDIDCWRDEMEWTIWEEDGFEVSKAINDSGLMKKTISFPESGRIHHVVSYYTTSDAQILQPIARQGVDMAVWQHLIAQCSRWVVLGACFQDCFICTPISD